MNLQFWCFLLLIANTECSKILLVFPVPAKSHFVLGSALGRGLAEAGHNVTFMGYLEDKYVVKNGSSYKTIVLQEIFNGYEKSQFDMFTLGESPLTRHLVMSKMMEDMTRNFFNSKGLKDLIKSGETFDVVIVEEFLSDSIKIVSHIFKVPLIVFSPLGPYFLVNQLVGNPTPLSYAPNINLPFSSRMTFLQRVLNVLMHVLFVIYSTIFVVGSQRSLLNELYPDGPCLNQLRNNVSLVLLNSHVSFTPSVPIVPNMIPIGGFHIKPPPPLPADLQEYLDAAPEGVIYFSMGSLLKSKNMPEEKIKMFVSAFKQLNHKVLWKWEDEILTEHISNIRTQSWLPQESILAHPNVKLFITHGGLLSMIETVYHGKPVLALPIYGDQPTNSKQMESGGIGLSIDYKKLNDPMELLNMIQELLKNPKYYDMAQTKSKIMRDQPLRPMESAIYWIEHVIKYKGAPHLRVAGADLSWYQYYLLDVYAFITSTIVILVGLFFYLCKRWFITKNIKQKTN